MIRKMLQTRRATHALASAMRRKDLGDMQFAIEQGANLDKVNDTFDEPGQHFMMSYGVKGALELAIENRLPMEAFRMLLDAGARVPTKLGDRPHPEALFSPDELHHWGQAKEIIALIKERWTGEPAMALATQPARRPGM